MYNENKGAEDMNEIPEIQPNLEEVPEIEHKDTPVEVINGALDTFFPQEEKSDIRRKDDEGHTLN